MMLFAAVLTTAVVAGGWLLRRPVSAVPELPARARITLREKPLLLELALTDDERRQGLSGREQLSPDEGMLFVFGEAGIFPFWMKEMKFPLDIIWIRNGVVVDVASLPPPDGLAYPATHTPTEPADMVLELVAGGAERYGLSEGVSLPEIKELRSDL